jgi:hypothetical protein
MKVDIDKTDPENQKEEWRPVGIGQFRDKYEVSSFGRVRNSKRGSILKPDIDHEGYVRIVFYDAATQRKRYTTKVHRIVAVTFIENPNNLPIVNHKDGNKSNNSVSNLEWFSHSENNIHRHQIINAYENLETKIALIDAKIRSLQERKEKLLQKSAANRHLI